MNKVVSTQRQGVQAIQFECSCGNIKPGRAEDTLISEKVLTRVDLQQKHSVMLDQVLHVAGRLDVRQDCVCGMDYMTLVMIGANLESELRCDCGHVIAGSRRDEEA